MASQFPTKKRLADFDRQAQPGVGKTHFAIGMGVACAELGHRVYFVSALEAACKLALALAENRLHRADLQQTLG